MWTFNDITGKDPLGKTPMGFYRFLVWASSGKDPSEAFFHRVSSSVTSLTVRSVHCTSWYRQFVIGWPFEMSMIPKLSLMCAVFPKIPKIWNSSENYLPPWLVFSKNIIQFFDKSTHKENKYFQGVTINTMYIYYLGMRKSTTILLHCTCFEPDKSYFQFLVFWGLQIAKKILKQFAWPKI